MTKIVEGVAEVIGKWVAEGRPYPTTTIEIEDMLEWYYGPAGYTKAYVETTKRILESRPDRPQWTKTPVSPFIQTIFPHTLPTKTKDMTQLNAAPQSMSIFGKSVEGVGEYSFDEITLDDVVDTLTLTIVYDVANKKIVLLCGILNYTAEDQQNIGFGSGSCSGKSHICLEIAKLFPEEDVHKLGYASSQSFFHDWGILTDEAGRPLVTRDKFVSDNVEKWKEKNPRPEEHGGKTEWKEQYMRETSRLRGIWNAIQKVYQVDLHQKILIFLDQPHDLLLRRLRALLSHDDKKIRAKITDRSSTGGHRTKAVDLIGFPSVWFLTTHFSPDEQERSRMMMLSAEITQEKLKDSLDMVSKKLADRDAFQNNLEINEKRNELKARIRAIKEAGIEQIIIAEDDREEIITTFKTEHPFLAPRLQRDFPRLIALIKGHALLNLFTREREGNRIWVNKTDVKAGKELYAEIAESNELGLPPVIYGVWMEIIKVSFDKGEGIRTAAVAANYYRLYRERIGGKRLDSMIDILIEVGLVVRITDPDDKRRVLLWDPDMELPKAKQPTKEETEAMAARGSGRKKSNSSNSRGYQLLVGRLASLWEKAGLKPNNQLTSKHIMGLPEGSVTHPYAMLEECIKEGLVISQHPEKWWLTDLGKTKVKEIAGRIPDD